MLDLVEYLADWVVDTPLLIACMARPELLEARPAWGGGKLNATSINLEPLSASECGTLVANLLAIDTVDPHRPRAGRRRRGRASVVRGGDARDARRRGTGRPRGYGVGGGRRSRRPLGAAHDVRPARGPDRPARRAASAPTLERASVMGQLFYREALDALVGRRRPADLASLVRKQFVRPERSDVPGMEAMAFRHLMIRDAAYEGMPKALRADLHERFADWLEARAPEQQELIGYHLEQAHRYLGQLGGSADRIAGIAERAATHLRSAGRRSYDRFDVPATVGLLSRATDLMPLEDPDRAPALIDLGIALVETADFDRAYAALDDATAIAERGLDESLAARARIVRTYVSFWGEGPVRIDEAEGRVQAELTLVEDAGDDLGAAWAWAVLGAFTWGRTQAAESKRAWRRAVDLFRRAGDQHMAGEYLEWLTATPVWGPTPCVQAIEETEAYAVEVGGSLAVQAEVRSSSATLFWMMGDFDEARRRSEAAHQGRLELGRPLADAHMSQVAGWIELMAGRALEAERILGEGARDLAALGSAYSARLLSAMHAQSLYVLGRYDEADEAAIVGGRGAEGDVTTDVLSSCVRAMVAARRGSVEDAERLARDAIAMIDQGDFINDQADARMALAEVLQLAGRVPEAAEAVQEALAHYRTKGNVTQAALAESRLADLRT